MAKSSVKLISNIEKRVILFLCIPNVEKNNNWEEDSKETVHKAEIATGLIVDKTIKQKVLVIIPKFRDSSEYPSLESFKLTPYNVQIMSKAEELIKDMSFDLACERSQDLTDSIAKTRIFYK